MLKKQLRTITIPINPAIAANLDKIKASAEVITEEVITIKAGLLLKILDVYLTSESLRGFRSETQSKLMKARRRACTDTHLSLLLQAISNYEYLSFEELYARYVDIAEKTGMKPWERTAFRRLLKRTIADELVLSKKEKVQAKTIYRSVMKYKRVLRGPSMEELRSLGVLEGIKGGENDAVFVF